MDERGNTNPIDMEFLLELIFEIFGEFILQFVFEALSEAGLHLFGRSNPREPPRAWVAGFGCVLLGCLCGGLSLWLFPTFFIQSRWARNLNLAVTPVLAAGAVTLLGLWRARRGEALVRLDKFLFAYLFAFSMAAVRFVYADLG
jgi:hypothetical protein